MKVTIEKLNSVKSSVPRSGGGVKGAERAITKDKPREAKKSTPTKF